MFFLEPNIIGLPGCIAIFQKSNLKPIFINELWVKSYFPTDAPPIVTNKSHLLVFPIFFDNSIALSSAIPKSIGSPPQFLISEIIDGFDEAG